MRPSSIFTLIIVFVLFVVMEGAVLYSKYLAATSIDISESFIKGEAVTVGTPFGGIVKAVHVSNGQHVVRGQLLFTILVQSPGEDGDGTDAQVRSLNSGIVSDIAVTANSFAQAGQVLARVIDSHPGNIYVEAILPITPEEPNTIVPFQRATVTASFLNRGEPIVALVTNVDPYDDEKRTLVFRLRMLEPLTALQANTMVGLPVAVTVTTRERVGVNEFVRYVIRSMFSASAAE
jgi:hypothetical protein